MSLKFKQYKVQMSTTLKSKKQQVNNTSKMTTHLINSTQLLLIRCVVIFDFVDLTHEPKVRVGQERSSQQVKITTHLINDNVTT